jgi:hypothetical protein
MVERRDVDFEVEGGDRLRGWLFQPERKGRTRPAISIAHAYAGGHGLERFASADALSFYLQPVPPGAWTNEVTVRSGRGRAFRCLPWAVRGDEQRRRILVSSASDRGL